MPPHRLRHFLFTWFSVRLVVFAVANQARAESRPPTSAASAEASRTLLPITLRRRRYDGGGFPRLQPGHPGLLVNPPVVLDRGRAVVSSRPVWCQHRLRRWVLALSRSILVVFQ